MRHQQRLTRPVADKAGESAQIVVEAALHHGGKQVGAANDTRHLPTFPVESRQVSDVTEVVGEKLDCWPGSLWEGRVLLQLRPLGENLTALFDAYSVAQVVAQHNVEPRQHHLQKEVGQRSDPAIAPDRNQHLVVHVAVQDKLACRVALVELNRFLCPGWKRNSWRRARQRRDLNPLGRLPHRRFLGRVLAVEGRNRRLIFAKYARAEQVAR